MVAGSVYAIADAEGYIKIGVTKGNPEARRAELQTGNKSTLSVLAACPCADALETEKTIHYWLREVGLGERGEWFKPSIHLTVIVSFMIAGDLDGAYEHTQNLWAWSQMPPSERYRFAKWQAIATEAEYILNRACDERRVRMFGPHLKEGEFIPRLAYSRG